MLSPVQIEHLVQGYLGWAGATVLAGTDMLLTRPLIDSPTRPEVKLTEYPVIKRFMRAGPNRNTKYTTQFYEQLEELNQVYADAQKYKRLRMGDEYEARVEGNEALLQMRKMYTARADQLSELNRRMDITRADNELTPAQKRAEIDELQLLKNEITRDTAEVLREEERAAAGG